ncbi:MAG: S1 family peptidase, partial [Kribbellaceae bacterium]
RPPARPPRAWYLLPLLLAVLLAGAGTGWLVRERADRFDLGEIREDAGPAVVRVFASSCSGTGVATGLLIDDDRVLTVASTLTGPVSVAVQTADGRVRPAQAEGVDRDGVVVLQLLDEPLGTPPAVLADTTPVDGLDVPVLGFIDGRQDIDMHAITRSSGGTDLVGVSGLLPASAAGSAVLDREGRAIGLVTRPGQTGTRAVGLGVLREFAERSRETSVLPRVSGCTEAKGSQAAVLPELDGPSGALAEEVQRVLGSYLTGMNRHDEQAMRATFTGRLDKSPGLTAEALEAVYRTTTIFGAVIRSVRQDGDGAQAEMSYVALRSADPDRKNLKCLRWDITYILDRVDGELRIAQVTPARGREEAYRSCAED